MEQIMTEQELELLRQIQEDLDIAVHEYGCEMSREKLLSKVLERNLNEVRPEEAALFFAGVLPSGWQQSYLRKKKLSYYLNKLRDEIYVQWCKKYLEPELSALHRSDSIKAYFKDHEIPASNNYLGILKSTLGLQCRKKDLFAFRERIDEYLKELRKQANISPHFRFIRPERFAAIVNIYLDAMEERGECTQDDLGTLLSIKQGTVSKLRNVQNNITAEKEYQVLLCLYFLIFNDDPWQKQDVINNPERLETSSFIYLFYAKRDWLFAAIYLAILLGITIHYHSNTVFQPMTVDDLNHFLEDRCFDERFDPDVEDTFCINEPEKTEYDAIPLWSLVRLPDKPSDHWKQEFMEEIMQIDAAHLRLLYRMPEVFFHDLSPHAFMLDRYLEEMRQLRLPGLECLMSKMETITAGWEVISDPNGIAARNLSVYLKDFYQLMEYLTDIRYFSDGETITKEYHMRMSCDLAIFQRRSQKTDKPLSEAQEREYSMLFENYYQKYWINIFWRSELIKRIKLKFSMTVQEWYFWLKMELLWFKEHKTKLTDDAKRWEKFIEQSLDEARKADRDSDVTAKDIVEHMHNIGGRYFYRKRRGRNKSGKAPKP